MGQVEMGTVYRSMKSHSIWDHPPTGFRLYVTNPYNARGVWLLVPVYWLAVIWRRVRIVYYTLVQIPVYHRRRKI